MTTPDRAHIDVDARVFDNRDQSRYEILIGDVVAGYSEYRTRGEAYAVTHTVTEKEFEGKGVGSRLVREMLDDLRGRGVAVLPYCPFVRSYIQQHREYADLVPEEKRARFGLD